MTTIHVPQGPIDPFLRAHRDNTRFVLGPDVYYTGGAWNFRDLDFTMLGGGCELVGQGSRHTEIVFDPIQVDGLIPAGATQNEILTAGGRTHETIAGVRLTGFTVDCALSALPTVGVHTWDSSPFIQDVAVDGVWGTRSSGSASTEGFGILCNTGEGERTTSRGGAVLRDCRVALAGFDTDENYVTGIYVGMVSDDPQETPHVVENCHVTQSPLSAPAHAAFASNGNVFWHAISNSGRFNRAFFMDTGGGHNIVVSGAFLRAEYCLIDIKGKNAVWGDIRFSEIVGTLTQGGSADHVAGLVLSDLDDAKNTSAFQRIQFQGVLRNLSGKKAYLGSTDAAQTFGCRIDATIVGEWNSIVFGPKARRGLFSTTRGEVDGVLIRTDDEGGEK